MHLAIESLDIPEEFRNTEREWAVFEAPALQSQQQQEGRQYMPGELYFYERTIGISTWYQPMDLVVPAATAAGQGGNSGAKVTPVSLLLAAGREWQQQERQRRMEKSRLKARQDRPSSQRALVGAPNWVAVDTVQGRTYYHNKGTGQSVWEKPRVDPGSSSNGEHEAKAEESAPEEAPPGTEFNAEDAEWMLAQMNGDNEEEEEEEEEEEDTETNINDSGPAVDSMPPASKAERELQFKQMLVDAAVDPFASWDTQARRFQHDKRVAWIPTEAERRDLFDEVAAQTLEKRREADAQTTQKQKQKQTALSPFDELLFEKVHGRMAFARFCQKNLEDPRYLSVKTSRERERRFKEFVDKTFGND